MSSIYRGYPQALYAAVQPYMLYRREEQTGGPTEAEQNRRRRNEAEYFKGLYPLAAREPQRRVEAAVDRLDYAGSPMYDEYPDRETLYRLRDAAAGRPEAQTPVGGGFPAGGMSGRDLTLLLLLNEIYRRRVLKRG